MSKQNEKAKNQTEEIPSQSERQEQKSPREIGYSPFKDRSGMSESYIPPVNDKLPPPPPLKDSSD